MLIMILTFRLLIVIIFKHISVAPSLEVYLMSLRNVFRRLVIRLKIIKATILSEFWGFVGDFIRFTHRKAKVPDSNILLHDTPDISISNKER